MFFALCTSISNAYSLIFWPSLSLVLLDGSHTGPQKSVVPKMAYAPLKALTSDLWYRLSEKRKKDVEGTAIAGRPFAATVVHV